MLEAAFEYRLEGFLAGAGPRAAPGNCRALRTVRRREEPHTSLPGGPASPQAGMDPAQRADAVRCRRRNQPSAAPATHRRGVSRICAVSPPHVAGNIGYGLCGLPSPKPGSAWEHCSASCGSRSMETDIRASFREDSGSACPGARPGVQPELPSLGRAVLRPRPDRAERLRAEVLHLLMASAAAPSS